MGAFFDMLLQTGIMEVYDPEVHGREEDFASVIHPLHVVIKAGSTRRPIIDPTRSGVNAWF